MCYALPGRIKSIKDTHVVIEYYGEEKKAINELRNLEIGDFVYAQGGFVIEKITPVEANNILRRGEICFELKRSMHPLSRSTSVNFPTHTKNQSFSLHLKVLQSPTPKSLNC